MKYPLPRLRQMQPVLSLCYRLLLATLGGYACTLALISLLARLSSLWFGTQFSAALLGAMLLSFLLYSLIIIWVISSNRQARTSLQLLLLTLLPALLCQLPVLQALP